MAALKHAWLAAVLLTVGTGAGATCEFDDDFEYVNPTAPDCGDVLLRYTEHAGGDPDDVPLGYPVPVPVDSLTPVAGFRSYASLLAGQQDLLASHDVVTGQVVGQTLAGRNVWAYRIGRGGAATIHGQPKGAVMAVGGVHAREWQPPEAIAEVFERLVAGRDDGSVLQYLVDNVAIVLLPVLNIDGFLATQQHPDRSTADRRQPRDGRMRRKNLRVPAGGAADTDLATVDDNTHGIDLNRNHPVGFHSDPRNAQPRSLIFAGDALHSEPETNAFLAALALAPAERLRLFMDVHSFTQVYIAMNTGDPERDRLTEQLAARMRAVTGNKYAYTAHGRAGAIGTLAAYVADAYGAPSWTLETEPRNGGQDYGGSGASHSGFITPDSEIARLRDELARTFVLGFYRQAGPPSVVAAEIRDADGAVAWSVDWVPDGAGARRLEQRSDGALAPGGDYTAWLAFDKPMRWREAGAVAQYPGQAAALQPELQLEVEADGGNRVIALDGGAWLAAPGPGPDGFLNYRDDAYAVSFTLPADLPDGATAAVLVVAAEDLSGQPLDAEPADAADWREEGWVGYQDGAPDCTLRLWVGAVGAAPHALACTALDDAPGPPTAPPPARGGGGHAGLFWLLWPLFIAAGGGARSRRSRAAGHGRATSGR